MSKIIDDLLKGQFDFDKGSLDFSCQNIEISVKKNEDYEGSFYIYGPGGKPAEGNILSSEIRMECLTREFTGTEEEILFRFRSAGMEEGEVLEGEFTVISDCGEYEIPFRAELETKVIESSMGEIRNVFHFVNLAKAHWEEALKIYYSKDFVNIFNKGSNRQFYSAYKGLSTQRGNQQHMEEFLLEINKKQRITYTPGQEEISLEDICVSVDYELSITKTGWGYTSLLAEGEGDFLSIKNKYILAEDFTGGDYLLPYHISFEELHAGKNCGCIHISGSYVDIRVPVTVTLHGDRKRAYGIRRERKQLTVQLLEYYEAFRTRKISGRIWLREAGKVVEQMKALDDKDISAQLFGVQLLITEERLQEAGWQMERIRGILFSNRCPVELECYYHYLTTLYDDGCDVEAVTGKIEQAYKENPDSWRIAWLMLYLSEEYTKSPPRTWLVLKDQFKRGCTSPVVYVEAWHHLEMNPTLLMKLGDFEVQVLNFAARRSLLRQDVVAQLTYLARKLKSYSERVFCILKECYEGSPDNEVLHAICSLLIKGNKTQTKYFEWYRMGVEQELRITRLYEYFMMSLPEDYSELFPKVILMYFSYQSELDYRKNALLYSYVFRNREEQPEMYLSYCEKMERFVLDQIGAGRINADLAYLYENTLTPRLINEPVAQQLATLLFMHEVTTQRKDIRCVSVIYSLSQEEYQYPVSEGKAMVPLYSSDYSLILVDKEDNRYCAGQPYEAKKLMKRGKMTQLIGPYVADHGGLDIFMCEGNKAFSGVHEQNAGRFRRIAQSCKIERQSREEIRRKLLQFYYEMDHIRDLDQFLTELEPDDMSSDERSEMIRFLVLRTMYDKAFSWIKRFGASGVEAKTIMRLCSRMISRDGFIEDEAMTYAVSYAYRKGKYDVNLIAYLSYFYSGGLRQMRDIWKAAAAFDVDTYDLCERMIIRMLYAASFIGERVDVFKSYVSGGAKASVEGAFLAQCAYDYFVEAKASDEFVFLDMIRVYERGESLPKVCKLSLLKYAAENKEQITPQLKERLSKSVRWFLRDLAQENVYFPFFKEYLEDLPMIEQLVDKTMVEFRTRPHSKVMIHFLVEKGTGKSNDYKTEEMREMYDGIYVSSFILFFGERLQYYITEDGEEDKQVAKSASISKSDAGQEALEGRFGIINDIVIGKIMQDYDTVDCLLEEYFRKEFVVGQMFKLR